jgi:hypothetical protein
MEIKAEKGGKYSSPLHSGTRFLGTRLLVSPGSLHAVGEIYAYVNGDVRPFIWDGTSLRFMASDLLLPRGLSDDLRRLADPGWNVYFIRIPSIGLGSNRLVIDENLMPMLVSTLGDKLSPSSVNNNKKHV